MAHLVFLFESFSHCQILCSSKDASNINDYRAYSLDGSQSLRVHRNLTVNHHYCAFSALLRSLHGVLGLYSHVYLVVSKKRTRSPFLSDVMMYASTPRSGVIFVRISTHGYRKVVT